ncbi:MAG: alanine racemase [Lachnospiraceae bacterium]
MGRDILEKMNDLLDTPAYVFHLDQLTAHMQLLRNKLGDYAQLCYAMKANPFLIGAMGKLVDTYEVCSQGEFRICEREKIPMERIVLSGVNKEQADIEYILDTYGGKGKFTIESWKQLQILEECASKRNMKIKVLIRITSGNQFGLDEQDVCKIIENRFRYNALDFKGLQYYSGTQKKKLTKIEKELQYLDKLCQLLDNQYHFKVKELEYGPGFFVSYFKNEDNADVTAVIDGFVSMLQQLQFQGKLTLEMGRFMVASCGYYFTKIIDQKRNQDQNYCIVDGGINHLNYFGQTMAMKIPKYMHIKKETQEIDSEDDIEKWNVCGSLCTVGDVLVKGLPLHKARMNDILVFENMGAYSVTEGIYLFLSRKLPKIYSYTTAEGMKLMRDALQTDSMNGAM